MAPWTGHYFDLPSFLNISYSAGRGFLPFLPHELGGYVKGAAPFFWDTPWTAYPPPWPAWLGATYFLGHWNLYVHILLIKLPIIVGDLLLVWLIYKVVATYSQPDLALRAAMAYSLFPPAVLIGSIWGMPDALGSLFLLLSVITASTFRSALLSALSVSIKLLTIVQWPAVVIETLARRGMRSAIMFSIISACSVLLSTIVPFAAAVPPNDLYRLILPNLYATYSHRLSEVSGIDEGLSYLAAYRILFHSPLQFDPSIVMVIVIAVIYAACLIRRPAGDDRIFLMLAVMGLVTILLLGRSNPQYFMIAYPFMVISSHLCRQRALRYLFHASWSSWLLAVLLQQNPARFLNPILPGSVGTVREIHGHDFGNPGSPFASERFFYWLLHSPEASWLMPAALISFLLTSTAYAGASVRRLLR